MEESLALIEKADAPVLIPELAGDIWDWPDHTPSSALVNQQDSIMALVSVCLRNFRREVLKVIRESSW